MTCRHCKFFSPQTTASGRIKRAAGRCACPLPEMPPLPAVVDRRKLQGALEHRYAAWPDDNEGCPTFEGKDQ